MHEHEKNQLEKYKNKELFLTNRNYIKRATLNNSIAIKGKGGGGGERKRERISVLCM